MEKIALVLLSSHIGIIYVAKDPLSDALLAVGQLAAKSDNEIVLG